MGILEEVSSQEQDMSEVEEILQDEIESDIENDEGGDSDSVVVITPSDNHPVDESHES